MSILQLLSSLLLAGLSYGFVTACQPPPRHSPPVGSAPDSGLPAPPAPPPTALIALLTPAHVQQIRTLGLPLVVPTAIPSGFQVDQVLTQETPPSLGYQILYRDHRDRCFLVEYAAREINNIPTTEYRLPIQPPFVTVPADYGLNYGHYVDPALKAQFPEPELISDWLPLTEGAYRLAGAAYINDTVAPSPPCQDLAPETMIQIIESSAPIQDAISGDAE